MGKIKDKLDKYKWWFCGAVVCGTCLYLANTSEFKKEQPKKDNTQIVNPRVNKGILSTPENLEDKTKLIGYSMTDAFKYGVINSINDYTKQAPYKKDTVNFSGDFNQLITYGYYQKINGKKHVVISHINPDTLSIPNASPFMKRMIVSFAKYHNDENEVSKIKAHEFWHQNNDPDIVNGADIQLKNKTTRGIFDYNMSAEEYATLIGHDEMSCRINGLLSLREQYKKNMNLSIFKGEYKFYGDAVRSGQINPLSSDSIQNRSEQLFIVSAIHDQWETTNKYNYEDYTVAKLNEHKPMDENRKNEYNDALNHAYTFIWDGKLVNMNFISDSTLSEIELTEREQEAVKQRQALEKCTQNKEEHNQNKETELSLIQAKALQQAKYSR